MKKNNDADQRQFTPEQGQVLVRLARKTIEEELGMTAAADDARSLAAALEDSAFSRQCSTFVTLHIDGRLRGCIGSLIATESVRENVRCNALNAAFQDSRFPPLSADELERIDIEVSVLSEPHPLAFSNAADLLKRLRPHIDGVIIRKGLAGATFLPQVWDQLPRPEDFLSRLCLKAGLPATAWQDTQLEVSTYHVQYFAETA